MPMNSREDVQRVNSAVPQVRQGHEDSVKLHHDFGMMILTDSVISLRSVAPGAAHCRESRARDGLGVSRCIGLDTTYVACDEP